MFDSSIFAAATEFSFNAAKFFEYLCINVCPIFLLYHAFCDLTRPLIFPRFRYIIVE